MFFVDADANTSAGAPLVIWVAKAELAPKLNFTVSPGWAASNCLPSSVKVSFRDDAANTVIIPVCAALLLLLAAAGADELVALEAELGELLLEHPATATAASATLVRAERRMFNSLVESSRARSAGLGDLSADAGPGECHPVRGEPSGGIGSRA